MPLRARRKGKLCKICGKVIERFGENEVSFELVRRDRHLEGHNVSQVILAYCEGCYFHRVQGRLWKFASQHSLEFEEILDTIPKMEEYQVDDHYGKAAHLIKWVHVS